MNTHKIDIIYDRDYTSRHLPASKLQILDEHEQQVHTVKQFLGGETDFTLFAYEHDPQVNVVASAFQANQVICMNGNRVEKMAHYVEQKIESAKQKRHKINAIISADPGLASFLEKLADTSTVFVYVPGKQIPTEYLESAQRINQQGGLIICKLLADFENKHHEPSVSIEVDLENLIHALLELGISFDPLKLRQALLTIARRYGKLINEEYAADWLKLPCGNGAEIMQALGEQGAKTLYTPTRAKKNSLDLILNNAINTLIEQMNTEVILCFTHDKDFRDIFRIARSRGVKIVAGGIRGLISQDLINAADEVVYLDDVLPELKMVQMAVKEPLQASDPMAELIMSIAVTCYKRGWKFITRGNLFSLFASTLQKKMLLEQVLHEGFISGPDEQGHYCLNYDRKLVRAICKLIKRLVECIHYALGTKEKAFVSLHYLTIGLLNNRPLVDLGLAQDERAAITWIELAAAAGLLVICLEPDPNWPGREINICRLLE